MNLAERAIQSVKNHIISILAGADPDFPKDQWDLLLPHAKLTLNISRPSRLNPRISANTLINGEFDFDKIPLAPAGCKVILHDGTEHRPSWANHGSRGFYIGPALKHYRCYDVLMVKSNDTSISNTVDFFPHMCDNPIPSAQDRLNMILEDLVETLGSPAPSIPSVRYGTDLNNAIRQLQTLMCWDQQGHQMKPEEVVNESTPLPSRPTGPITRSQTYKQEPIGTIV